MTPAKQASSRYVHLDKFKLALQPDNQWVITVPALWSGASKNKMWQFDVHAGIITTKMLSIGPGAGAGVCMLAVPVYLLSQERGGSEAWSWHWLTLTGTGALVHRRTGALAGTGTLAHWLTLAGTGALALAGTGWHWRTG